MVTLNQIYLVTVTKEQLEHASDMLRYDGCYDVRQVDADTLELHLTRFTPERWRSFGVGIPKNVFAHKVQEKEHRDHRLQADGFTRGVRYAQKRLGGHIMQEL